MHFKAAPPMAQGRSPGRPFLCVQAACGSAGSLAVSGLSNPDEEWPQTNSVGTAFAPHEGLVPQHQLKAGLHLQAAGLFLACSPIAAVRIGCGVIQWRTSAVASARTGTSRVHSTPTFKAVLRTTRAAFLCPQSDCGKPGSHDGLDAPCSAASRCHSVVGAEPDHEGEEASMEKVTTIGLDLAKSVLQVHARPAAACGSHQSGPVPCCQSHAPAAPA